MTPRILYCFWFGPGMSEDRNRCFESIKSKSGVDVRLITINNLQEYLLPDFPLHSGFNFLSDTHKSDYLRSYFMHCRGGGYTDIKQCHYDWNYYFDLLDNSDKEFIGCKQYTPKHIAYSPYKDYYDFLVGVNCFIFKKNTAFSKLWFETTNSVMDAKIIELVKNPGTYHHRAVTGGVQGLPGVHSSSEYPFLWNELLGRIFHKLQYENLGTFLYDLPFPDTTNYR